MYPLLNFIAFVALIISVISIIRPIATLKIPTRKHALAAFAVSIIVVVAVQELKPPPSPEEYARIEKQERERAEEKKQKQIEREKAEQERKQQKEKERLAKTQPSNITFREVYSKFGIDSQLTDLQKKEEWKKYDGKCIEWRGQLVHLDEGLLGGLVVGFKHLPNTFTYDVLVSAPESMRSTLMSWEQNKYYTYKGRLDDYGTIMPIQVDWGCE